MREIHALINGDESARERLLASRRVSEIAFAEFMRLAKPTPDPELMNGQAKRQLTASQMHAEVRRRLDEHPVLGNFSFSWTIAEPNVAEDGTFSVTSWTVDVNVGALDAFRDEVLRIARSVQDEYELIA
ncbi:MAG: hypothetical protein JWN73_1963 [Betaproteobacteria bacterium]|nr:hypothetical protein [Betaproteobacteria bacterium]